MSEMKDVVAILHTSEFRGDHSADVAIICDLSVEEKQALTNIVRWRCVQGSDYIVVRPVFDEREGDE